MTCSKYRDLISLRIDDELQSEDETQLDRHLGTCASCHSYQNDAFALRRSFRLRAVNQPATRPTPATDPATEIVGSLRGVSLLRWALFVIGGTLVLLNASAVLSAESGAAAHLSRHDGVFGAALGIGMLAVAAKPHRAIGLVPLTSAIAVLMLVVAIADVVAGNANLLSEAVHLVQFAGLVCLWIISGGPTRLPKHLAMVGQRLPLAG